MFNTVGFAQTTILDIAEKANVSIGCFYEYFDNKEALLAEYLSAVDVHYSEYYDTVLNVPGNLDNGLQKIREFLVFSVQLLTNRSKYKDMLRVYYSYLCCNSTLLTDHNRHFFKVLSKLIDQALADGSLRSDLSKDFVTNLALYLFRSITIEWCSNCDQLLIDSYIPIIDDLVFFLKKQGGIDHAHQI